MPGRLVQQAQAAASCLTHPGAAAAICARCGTFVCSGCLTRSQLCAGCVARLRPSTLAIASAIVGGLSFCGFFPGIIAIILATIELGRISRGVSAEQGADWARGGRALGAIALLLGVVTALVLWA